MKQFDTITATIHIRPEYKGRKPKPGTEALNGMTMDFLVAWLIEPGESYPGEYALTPKKKEDADILWKNGEVVWIASGDVKAIRRADGHRKVKSNPITSHGMSVFMVCLIICMVCVIITLLPRSTPRKQSPSKREVIKKMKYHGAMVFYETYSGDFYFIRDGKKIKVAM